MNRKANTKAIMQMVNEGYTACQIAAHERMTVSTVRKWLRKMGLTANRSEQGKAKKMDDDLIIAMWRSGHTCEQIAEAVNSDMRTVVDYMCRLGLTPINPTPDYGKIGALWGAGWSFEAIADDTKMPLHQLMMIIRGDEKCTTY